MPDLAAVLAAAPGVRWLVGTVGAVTGSTLTMLTGGGTVYNVGYVDQYVPVVGDVVHAIAWAPTGMLVIGSNNAPLTPRLPVPVSGPPVTVLATAKSTVTVAADSWAAGVLLAAPTTVACFVYPPIPISLKGRVLQRFTINLTVTSGANLEFVLHLMSAATGHYTPLADHTYRAMTPAFGAPVDIALPLEWGGHLIDGSARGVGLGGGDYSAVLTGSTGTLVFTPL